MSKRFERLVQPKEDQLLKHLGSQIHVIGTNGASSTGFLKDVIKGEAFIIIFGKKIKKFSLEDITEVVIDGVSLD